MAYVLGTKVWYVLQRQPFQVCPRLKSCENTKRAGKNRTVPMTVGCRRVVQDIPGLVPVLATSPDRGTASLGAGNDPCTPPHGGQCCTYSPGGVSVRTLHSETGVTADTDQTRNVRSSGKRNWLLGFHYWLFCWIIFHVWKLQQLNKNHCVMLICTM